MTRIHRPRPAARAIVSLLLAFGALAGCDVPPSPGAGLRPGLVESKRWERSIVVEERRVVEGEGWEPPDSAQVIRTERRYHHQGEEVTGHRTVTRHVPRTERVADGTETRTREVEERVRTGTRTYVCGQRDRGNGYFEDVQCTEPVYETRTRTETWEEPRYREEARQDTVTERVAITRPVPVYRDWHTWRAPRWAPVDTLRARGDTTRPAWPDTTRLGENQRLGARTDRYTLVVRQNGMRLTLRTHYGQWHKLRPGERVALRGPSSTDTTRPTIFPADSLSDCQRWHQGTDKRPPPDSLGCSPRRR